MKPVSPRPIVLCLGALLVIVNCASAIADYPVHFIKATCVPEMDYFEISVSFSNNPHHLFSFDEKTKRGHLAKSVADSLMQKGILVLLHPGELRCSLKGMEIVVTNDPYASYERNLFPGSRVSLSINGRPYAESVDMFTGSRDRAFLTNVSINGHGYGNQSGYLYYTAKRGESGPELNIYQKFPGNSIVTGKTLQVYDGTRRILHVQEDGGTRK